MTLVLAWNAARRFARFVAEVCTEAAELRREMGRRHPHFIDR